MPLKPKIIAKMEKKLLSEKKRLEAELSSFAKPTSRPGDFVTKYENIGEDVDENASEVENYADNLALENTLEKELREVIQALERIKKGTYGYCSNCRKEIKLERLKAYPAASKCIECS